MGKYLGLIALTAIAAGIITSFSFATSAKTKLEICNRSDEGTVQVAIAYPNGKNGWNSQGWLSLKEGECSTMLEGNLTNRYYYYYAWADSAYSWKGEHRFCVSNRKFAFVNADRQCKGANSRWENFRELDTGRDATNFRLNLE
ncbi:DUF1036 domain-containing protein [Leptothermofonsia sp. ETS-13]|uniref:DUF1036 domain-containing protein n=1 Tax=Leptothermofonsia sp. ETS-13 TaxID=3035696 RepID=UPI003BA1D6C1